MKRTTFPIYAKDKGKFLKKLRGCKFQCEFPGCKRKGTDKHHRDGNHDNDELSNWSPACARCHNDHHGISPRQSAMGNLVKLFLDAQKKRIQTSNRNKAFARLYDGQELPIDIELYLNEEKALEKHIKKLVKEQPIWNKFFCEVNGVGPMHAGILVHYIKDIGRFSTPSKLRKFAGIGQERNGNGWQVQRAHKGKPHGYTPGFKTRLLGQRGVAHQLMIHTSLGKRLYYEDKEKQLARGLTRGHAHRRALRRVAQKFLDCLWVAWREIDKLPTIPPYPIEKIPGHKHIIKPKDWME